MIIWDELKLSEVTSYIKRGVSPKYVEKDGFPIINQKCIRENKVSYEHSKLISKLQNVNKDKFLQDGDVLVNSTGTGTLGRVAQYKKIGENIFCDTHVSIVRANDKIDKDFLAYQLSYKEPMIENYGKGATNQIELGTADLGLLKIQLPLLPIQKKIAKILSNYDGLIENNFKRIKLLEESARLTYEEWFLRFRINGAKLEIDSETGLPFGWEKDKLVNVADFKYGTMPKKNLIVDDGFPIYSGYRITGKYKEMMFDKPTLIIVARGVGGTGDVKITPRKCWLTNLSIALLVNDSVMKNYLFYHLKTLNLRSLDSGAAQSQITITSLEHVHIIKPSRDILLKFDNYSKLIFQEIETLTLQNQLLKEARDILLPRLMTGMIDVDELEVAV